MITTINLSFAVKVETILKSLDDLQKLNQDITARVEIVQKDKIQGTKLMESIFYGKDINDQFLIVMTKPEAEKGNGYLKINKNFWMYRKNTRTFQHINKDENIAGSDANAGDFESPKYAESYKAIVDNKGNEIIEESKIGDIDALKFEVIAKVDGVDYPKKILWVRKDNYLPLKEQSFSLSKTLMNTQYYLSYSKINNKYIAVKQLNVDEFEQGNKTLWEIKDISFKALSNDIFTKAYLENLSK